MAKRGSCIKDVSVAECDSVIDLFCFAVLIRCFHFLLEKEGGRDFFFFGNYFLLSSPCNVIAKE